MLKRLGGFGLNHLPVFFAFVKANEFIVELFDVWQFDVHLGLSVILADLES